jgi:hypothetical protein
VPRRGSVATRDRRLHDLLGGYAAGPAHVRVPSAASSSFEPVRIAARRVTHDGEARGLKSPRRSSSVEESYTVSHAAFGRVEPPVACRQEPSMTSWASPELGQVASQEEFTRSEEHFDGELFRNRLLRREISDLRLPGPHEEHTRAFEGDFSVHEGTWILCPRSSINRRSAF